MKFTTHTITLFRKQIEQKPIEPDELRRVKGLGNLFMSINKFPVDEEGEFSRLGWTYWFLYSMIIDEATYYFYGGTPDVLPEDTITTDPK